MTTAITDRQSFLGRALIDAGARAIIGHHPHVVQDIERYKNKPIVYSLGNFIFDQYDKHTLTGMAFAMVLSRHGISGYPIFFDRNPITYEVSIDGNVR